MTGLPIASRYHSVAMREITPGERKVLFGRRGGAPEVQESFGETQYGIVKRIRVIEEWVVRVSEQTGKCRLAILDYGCGTGDHITAPLAHWGNEVLGIDVHGPSILEARRRHTLPNLSFRIGVLQDLLDTGLSFDVIVCSEVLEHLHNPSEFLPRLRRLLRAGGSLIITTPNGYGSFEILNRLERALSRIGIHQAVRWNFWRIRQLIRRAQGRPIPFHPLEKMSGGQDPGFLNQDSVHVQLFRLGTLERMFADSGFRVVARGPGPCGVTRMWTWRDAIFRLNSRLADRPFTSRRNGCST